MSASLLGIISGTSTSTVEVLLPTTKELVTLPYPITLATTLNDFVSPEFRLTVHVIVRVIGSYTPPSAEISSKPSPKTSRTTTLLALTLPALVTNSVCYFITKVRIFNVCSFVGNNFRYCNVYRTCFISDSYIVG